MGTSQETEHFQAEPTEVQVSATHLHGGILGMLGLFQVSLASADSSDFRDLLELTTAGKSRWITTSGKIPALRIQMDCEPNRDSNPAGKIVRVSLCVSFSKWTGRLALLYIFCHCYLSKLHTETFMLCLSNKKHRKPKEKGWGCSRELCLFGIPGR